MPIGIDYTPAYEQGGGIGRLTRDLITALAQLDQTNTYRLFVAGANIGNLPPAPSPQFSWRPTRITPIWLSRMWYRARLPVPVELFTGSVDLFHATDFTLPPTLPKTKTIVTVHDLSFVRAPETASPKLKAFLDAIVPASIQQANHVIADSRSTKADILDLYGVEAEKVSVVLSGIDRRYQPISDVVRIMTIRNKYKISDVPYIFSIGTIQPRKNYSRLIQAMYRLRTNGYDLHLVIAGGRGWLEDEMYRTLADLHMHDVVHLIGFVDDEDLAGLYSSAECVAFPSLYEGFGFPVLEGMACGTPVITSNISSLPEVAGDAALMIDPYDIDAIANAIQRVIEDSELRERLIQKGFEQASGFTWERSARQLRAIYDQVLTDT
ncbi:MAG: glycosyltransferase family 4 protein [Anaerolineae bacterium]